MASSQIPKVYEDRLLGATKGPEKTTVLEADENGRIQKKQVKAETTDKFGTVIEKRQTLTSSKPRSDGKIEVDRGESGTVREDFA